jgi:hypothetical protein
MRLVVVFAVLTLCFACSPSMEGPDAGADAGGPTDAGQHGDAGLDAGVTPQRILFLFDGSPEMATSDPTGERAVALVNLINALPNSPDLEVAVVVFAGTTRGTLLGQGIFKFVAMPDLYQPERATLANRLLTWTPPGMPAATDWVEPFTGAYVLISNDTSLRANSNLPRARYDVVVVSGAVPELDQDDELLCGNAVKRVRDLRIFANDVRIHTVHLSKPTQAPGCAGDAGLSTASTCSIPQPANPGACPATEIDLHASRLRRIATLGGGAFRDVRDGAQVDYGQLLVP